MGKVKIVGYAKKEFFTDGIEYRNFSPDLVGNQFTSEDGAPNFSLTNFNITSNTDSKVNKNFVTKNFTNFMSLDTLNVDSSLNKVVTKYSKKAKLNLDYDDVLSYAYFGSFKEYIRVSLENVIIKWPASLYISSTDPNVTSNTGDTVTNFSFNPLTNESTFDIDTLRIQNPYEINFLSGGTIENTFNESNSLRNFTLNYKSYVVSNGYGDFKILNVIGASSLSNSKITLRVSGNPFPNYNIENINYHIKPNNVEIEKFFLNLNEFENKLLNRLSTPTYTSSFKVFLETENGSSILTTKKFTWPVTDGYNIDFNSSQYNDFVNELIELSETSDNSKSNLMVRFFVSSAISEFDTVPDVYTSYQTSNGQKMTSALKIYGREFDEIKNYSDSISFANVVTYDKKNNTPDIILKNLGRVLGWELTSAISQVDVAGSLLTLNKNYYDGYSRGLSETEAEIELWRRIILNTPWIWKSKGTRKAIEFLLKFMGVPKGLITFNEYLYVAKETVDVDLVKNMMEFYNGDSDITGLNVDSNGFPKILPNTPDMYFQKAGLWYRETGGSNPDIDVLSGNNPHIGPYDGGQEFINQFTNCLVPNYFVEPIVKQLPTTKDNLFTNFNNGSFDECCDAKVLVKIETGYDFNVIATDNLNEILNNYPVKVDTCTINNSWVLSTFIDDDLVYENTFFTSTGSTAPTEFDYVNEIYNISGVTEFSGVSFTFDSTNSLLSVILPNEEDCDSEFIDRFFKVELNVTSNFDCVDEGVSGLIEFGVSETLVDGCNNSTSYQPFKKLYHNGVSSQPQIGDLIYVDSLGRDLMISDTSVTNSDYYVGGGLSDSNSYLRTDSSGARIQIVCPVVECNVSLYSNEVDSSFYIAGMVEPTTVNVTVELINLNGNNGMVAVEIFGLKEDTILTSLNPSENREFMILPSSASQLNLDYDANFIVNVVSGVGFGIKMTINSMSDGCLSEGDSTTTINIPNLEF